MTQDARQRQIESNYAAFQAKLSSLLEEHRGEFALMRNGEVVEFFDTARDTYAAGKKMFEDGLFSVQEVTDVPIDLGFFSHALPEREIQSDDRPSH